MTAHFDIRRFREGGKRSDQYDRQLKRLKDAGKEVQCIEAAVRGAIENLRQKKGDSFVIYGEPQSGKTEMMICLTGMLVDEGYPFILHLLNDSVDLLDQNLGHLRTSVGGGVLAVSGAGPTRPIRRGDELASEAIAEVLGVGAVGEAEDDVVGAVATE
jgi:hypothetical protein